MHTPSKHGCEQRRLITMQCLPVFILAREIAFEVGILRPNWLDGATYLGQQVIHNITTNGYTKVVHVINPSLYLSILIFL